MSKKNFERMGIILESILKLIEKRNEVYETEMNRIEEYINSLIQYIILKQNALIELNKLALARKILGDRNDFVKIVNAPHDDAIRLEKEYKIQRNFFEAEKDMMSKELEEILKDIAEFNEQIKTEKE